MTFSHLERIDVRHLTTNQPFGAGVLLFHDGKLVVTLRSDSLPTQQVKGPTYRVGGIGGRQQVGETIWECAKRESEEKLSTTIQLLPSPITYFHNLDSGEMYPTHCIDPISPILVERQSNLYPYTPTRPGLPVGQYTYFSTFLSQTDQQHQAPRPSDYIEALLFLPLELWSTLQKYPTLERLLQQGASISEHAHISRDAILWTHPWEALHSTIAILRKHPELLGN